ncbi:LysR family transcriptional regulator [Microbulbifer taiwanensis]|uniref:LysR family transcriptional regulator n=1 Tax=Microbulbifer taiwanensis TaxID=986746 RepID=A0ABW1YJZ0_9GAMM|nr:LysR family transcriptional regulator [Microbulbifer taiwanensis]
MPLDTSAIAVFASVVKHSNFARAAEEQGMTPSGVSRVISRLEEHLGVRLLQRSTRRLSLTETGSVFHQRALQILRDLDEAEAEASAASLQPRGLLRLNVPVVFGRQHIVPLLQPLREKYPEMSIELSLSDRFVDLIEEGMDLAVRIGALADSRLIARRLCANRRLLVASPDYLKRRGTPQTAADLDDHDCLVFTGLDRPYQWRLVGPEGPVAVAAAGPLVCNNGEVLTEAAKGGLGIALGATFSISSALLSGELVRVLPGYEFEPTAIHAIYPSTRQLSRKVRATVDFLASAFDGIPAWDSALRGRVPGFELQA